MTMADLIGQAVGKIARQSTPKMSALEVPANSGTPGSFPGGDYELVNDEDLTLDHNSQDWKQSIPLDDEEQRRIVRFVRDQFDGAYRARQEMELEWALATAFFEGRQWLRIASQTRNLIQLQNPTEPNRYVTVQKMRPLIDGVVGKLTQVAPDAYAIPLSDTEEDRFEIGRAHV